MIEKYIKKDSVGEILKNFETDTNDILIGDIAMTIDNLPTVEIPQWHDLRKNPEDLPESEEKVLVMCERKYTNGKKRIIVSTAMYEDGTILDCDSEWNWEEIDWAGWDEENDCGIIPKGWYEYHEYNPNGILNYAIDDIVVKWCELPKED